MLDSIRLWKGDKDFQLFIYPVYPTWEWGGGYVGFATKLLQIENLPGIPTVYFPKSILSYTLFGITEHCMYTLKYPLPMIWGEEIEVSGIKHLYLTTADVKTGTGHTFFLEHVCNPICRWEN